MKTILYQRRKDFKIGRRLQNKLYIIHFDKDRDKHYRVHIWNLEEVKHYSIKLYNKIIREQKQTEILRNNLKQWKY